jgi:hypothetical protein
MRGTSLALLAVAASVSILWGIALERGRSLGVMGFPGIYLGTRCLLQGSDPYDVGQLQHASLAAGYPTLSNSSALRQSATLYVNLPTTFLFVAPFALLPLATAQMVWTALLIGSFLLATYLMWSLAEEYSPSVALWLTFIVLANCEIIFSGGNTAGFVVSLCVVAVWCFQREQFVTAGIVALAIGLAIKPHDAGMIWFFFLLGGPIQRKRAIMSGVVASVLALSAALWVSHTAPHWLPELRSNLATISGRGGINEPGPFSVGASSPDMIIDLQTVISIFADSPRVYNPATYAICGTVFLAWLIALRRRPPSAQTAWFALVSASALSMLVTYHRSYDAKLLLLAIPCCAMLWAERGAVAWAALVFSTAGVVFTADIPLAVLMRLTRNLYSPTADVANKLSIAFLTRPAPLVLLAISVFYLAVYVHRTQRCGTKL